MKLFLHVLLIVAGAAVGLAVGSAWRHRPASKGAQPSEKVAAAPSPTNGQPTGSLSKLSAAREADDSPLATRLQADLSMSAGVTRWLLWVDALENAKPADFPRLFRLAQGNPTARKLVGARWVELAPRHLFDTITSSSKVLQGRDAIELAELLFEEWPKHDPDAAIGALNEDSSKRRRAENWQWTVAYAVLDKDVERGLKLMTDWHVENIGFGPRGEAAIAKWTKANPRHAAEVMLAQGSAAYSFQSGMETVGREWAKIDPAAAMAFASSKQGELASTLGSFALKEWAGKNSQEAADWLAHTDDQTRNRLSSTFVETWAQKDASGALAWSEANLTGSTRAQSVAAVLNGVAQKDVVAAAALVTDMDPSRARSQAAVAVARKWFPDLASAHQTKPETIGWLANLDSESMKRVLDRITWGWATSDATSMAAFLSSTSADVIPLYSYSVVARELARKNPQEALAWASHLPERQGLAAGGDAFAEWRAAQPEAAMEWFNGLPADDSRREPFFQNAIRSVAYNPQAAEQLALMTPTERAVARGVIETMNLPEDRRTRLLDVLKR